MEIKNLSQWKSPFKQFEIKTNICKACFKEIKADSIYSTFARDPQLCSSCYGKFHLIYEKFSLLKVDCLAIYKYGDGIRSLLYQFKGCYDRELAPVFLERCRTYLKFKYAGYVIVPAPSTEESDMKRGFNHVVEIFKYLNKPIIRCIYKTENFKQTECDRVTRREVNKKLAIKNRYLLTNKKVLIVDDVKTTGSTLKAMINLVKECRPKRIKILVLSRKSEDEKL